MALLENSNWTLHWFQFWPLGGTTSISSKFTIRWRHHLVTKFVPNSSYRSNAWVRCASGNVLFSPSKKITVPIGLCAAQCAVKNQRTPHPHSTYVVSPEDTLWLSNLSWKDEKRVPGKVKSWMSSLREVNDQSGQRGKRQDRRFNAGRFPKPLCFTFNCILRPLFENVFVYFYKLYLCICI